MSTARATNRSSEYPRQYKRDSEPEGDGEVKFRVVLQSDEDGVIVAEVPALPGCISQGATREEAVDNIREAIAGYLDSLKAHGDPIPLPIDEEGSGSLDLSALPRI
jgi:predicted RNase H-like HicB family nuclease